MKELKNDITSKQLMMFIITSQIGVGIMTLPGSLAGKVGHDGWIVLLVSGVISIMLMVFIMLLLNNYKDKTILQINNILYGKYLGAIFNVFIILCFCVTSASTLRGFTEVIVIIVLKLTPPLVITILILLPTIYMCTKGLKVIVQYAFVIFTAYLVLFISFMLAATDMRITYLMPAGKAGFNAIIKSIPMTIYAYLGFELVSVLYSDVKDKKNALKFGIFGVAFTTIFYTIVSASVTAAFGEAKLSTLVYPIFSMQQMIKLPVFERMDIFFILLWLPTMGACFCTYFFSAYYSIIIFLKFKNNNMLLWVFLAIIVALSRIPRNFEETGVYANYIGMYGMSVILFFIFTYFFSLLIKRGVHKR